MSTASNVDQQLAEHLTTLTTKRKERLLRKLILLAENKKKRVPRQSLCRPRAQPVTTWKPKDVTTAKVVLSMLIDDSAGVVKSNIEGSTWAAKIMSGELAVKVVGTIPADAVRSTLATASMLVTALLARIFELASNIKEQEQLAEPVFEMQSHRGAAGFARSRGSGLVCNDAGLVLVLRAAVTLRSRLEQQQEP